MRAWQAVKLLAWMILVTGIFYPLAITFISYMTLPEKASGSFATLHQRKVGSLLIGQKFESEKYFWSRPSATDYNPLPSGASNLGPTSTLLKTQVDARRVRLAQASEISDPTTIPSDLLFASGSGLDPHITPSAAYFQIGRVAKARHMDTPAGRQKIKELVDSLLEKRTLGFLGVPCINVLRLNLALDAFEEKNG